MRTNYVLVAAACLSLTAPAWADDPELSADTKRMLSYGTLAVMTRSCQTKLTPAQTSKLNTGLEQSAKAQMDMNEAEFTEAMKAVGAQVGANRQQICAALTPEYVDTSLAAAATGD